MANKMDKIAVGQSACGGYLADIIALDKEKTGRVQSLGFSMHIKDATTAEQFKAALSGEEHEQAKAILLSPTEH